ncbi:MAG: hypothetical protein IJO14_00175 [Clostridia bacterium]|nr:hypothetical protein [Clostridia bacterium]
MKKMVCILLSVLMAFGLLAVSVGASEVIPVHYVCLDEAAQGYILIPLNEDGKYNSTYTTEDDDIENGSFYIPNGGTIRFVVEYEESYSDNFMTTVKYIATNRYQGSFNGDPALAENEAVMLQPDKNGVYTIANITEGITVTVYNVESESMSGIIDFIKELIAFLADLLMKFFGVDFDLGDEY